MHTHTLFYLYAYGIYSMHVVVAPRIIVVSNLSILNPVIVELLTLLTLLIIIIIISIHLLYPLIPIQGHGYIYVCLDFFIMTRNCETAVDIFVCFSCFFPVYSSGNR